MSNHSTIAQQILAHFALRGGCEGATFEPISFLRLAEAREGMDEGRLQAGLAELVRGGCVADLGDGTYHLTRQGYEHVHGKPETRSERADEIARRRHPSPEGH
jgi:hypothetical protein